MPSYLQSTDMFNSMKNFLLCFFSLPSRLKSDLPFRVPSCPPAAGGFTSRSPPNSSLPKSPNFTAPCHFPLHHPFIIYLEVRVGDPKAFRSDVRRRRAKALSPASALPEILPFSLQITMQYSVFRYFIQLLTNCVCVKEGAKGGVT